MNSRKNDIKDKKSRVDLIPSWIMLAVGDNLRHGAEKYSEYNYRNKPGLKFSRMSAAIKRHDYEFDCGEDIDKSSGSHHLICLICEAIMILDSQVNGFPEQDDRFK